jgi:site-specific DNA recombinase
MGLPASQGCKPAPTMTVTELDRRVGAWFVQRYDTVHLMRREFDPGNGVAARIAELESNRTRLRADREAGLYDSEEDTAWYQERYAAMSRELVALKALPDVPAGMRWVMCPETIGDQWRTAADDVGRRELLTLYRVKVLLYPTGSRHGRLWVHALDPEMEADAIAECARLDQEEDDARAELAELEWNDADAREAAREQAADDPAQWINEDEMDALMDARDEAEYEPAYA